MLSVVRPEMKEHVYELFQWNFYPTYIFKAQKHKVYAVFHLLKKCKKL